MPGLNKQSNKQATKPTTKTTKSTTKTPNSHNKSQTQQQPQFYAYSFSSMVTSNGKKTEEKRLELENKNGKVHGAYKKIINNQVVKSKIIRSEKDLKKLQQARTN